MRLSLFQSILSFGAFGLAVTAGCASNAPPGDDRIGESESALAPDSFTAPEWATIASLSPLPTLPVDTTNKYADSPAAASLGHRLFFDKRIAGPIQAGTPAEGQLGGKPGVGLLFIDRHRAAHHDDRLIAMPVGQCLSLVK